MKYAETNMRKSACPPLLPIRAREVIVFLKTKPRTRAALCLMTKLTRDNSKFKDAGRWTSTPW